MRYLFSLRPSKHRLQGRTGEVESGPRQPDLRYGSDQILGRHWLANLEREQRELLWVRRHA